MSTSIQRSNHATDGDRITYLHESVLSHVLSRLPTKDAIRTSILSKDWEDKWISSYKSTLIWKFGSRNFESFTSITNRMLLSSQGLRSFYFNCWGLRDLSCIQAWMSAVLRHKLEYLTVDVGGEGIVIPCCLLNSTSLKVLDMSMQNCVLNVALTSCAPNLTSLRLSQLKIENENPNSTNVSLKFPVLEKLSFLSCRWFNVESAEIYAPSLTKFQSVGAYNYHDNEYSMAIFAPRLTTLVYYHSLAEKIIVNDGSSTVSAHLLTYRDLTDDSVLIRVLGLQTANLVNRFTSLEELELSEFMAEALLLGHLHRLNKVTRLTLNGRSSPEQLFELLRAMPTLKYLTLSVFEWNDYDYESVEFMPSCIVSHLKKVVFEHFELEVPQYDLAKFLLKTSKYLKKFVISGYASSQKRSTISAVLNTFQRCSPFVKVSIPGRGLARRPRPI